MRVAIMQPYLFPYIGYWQLIHAADIFVIFDDVNYINRGYINRNSILVNGEKQLFTLELKGASQNKLINEIEIGYNLQKLLKTIRMTYKKAPCFGVVYKIIEDVFSNKEQNLARFIGDSLKTVSKHLGIQTEFLYSSDLKNNNNLNAEEKIIDIAVKLKANHYINAIGGQEIYENLHFEKEGIKLSFLKTRMIEYDQFDKEFVSHLSIIDIMMFNDTDAIYKMLNAYTYM